MPIIQKTVDGYPFVTLPVKLIRAKGWKNGDVIDFAIVDEINRPLPGDLFLRRNRSS